MSSLFWLGKCFLLSWAAVFLLSEVWAARSLRHLLGILLGFVGITVGFMLLAELDLLAVLLLSLYSSVFLVFFLVALAYARDVAVYSPQGLPGRLIFVLLGLHALLIVGSLVADLAQEGQSASFIWVDAQRQGMTSLALSVQALHQFFVRLFFLETLLLNLYLAVALMAVLLLLLLARLSRVSQRKLSGAALSVAGRTRTRQAARMRRQTRRQNASHLRYR